MMSARPAEPQDATWILAQLRAFDHFAGTTLRLFPDDDESARLKLLTLIDKHPVFVSELGHPDLPASTRLTGFIIGLLHPHFFNPRIVVLSEMFWWVTPDYRGTRAGALLLHAFEQVGRLHADWVVMTLEEKSPVNPLTLERRGFRLWERNYLLEHTAESRKD